MYLIMIKWRLQFSNNLHTVLWKMKLDRQLYKLDFNQTTFKLRILWLKWRKLKLFSMAKYLFSTQNLLYSNLSHKRNKYKKEYWLIKVMTFMGWQQWLKKFFFYQ